MKSLQKTDLMHGNLNPANIIVHHENSKLVIKFPNFWYARHLDDIVNKNIQIPEDTMCYLPPEVLEEKKYHPMSEIWSLGIIFYEMLFGKRPWEGKTCDELCQNILKKELIFPK